jgi:hypothetical protein
MQRLEVSCAVRPIYGSFGAKGYAVPGNLPPWAWVPVARA